MVLPSILVAQPAIVAEMFGGERNVGDARDGERLAVIERFELRELFEMLFDQIAELPDQFAALGRRDVRTMAGLERGARGFHRAVDVFAVAFGDVGEHFAGRGIDRWRRSCRKRPPPTCR